MLNLRKCAWCLGFTCGQMDPVASVVLLYLTTERIRKFRYPSFNHSSLRSLGVVLKQNKFDCASQVPNLLKTGVFSLSFFLLSGCILPLYTVYFLSFIEVLNATLKEEAVTLDKADRGPHTPAAATRPHLPWRPGPGLCWWERCRMCLGCLCLCCPGHCPTYTVLGLWIRRLLRVKSFRCSPL